MINSIKHFKSELMSATNHRAAIRAVWRIEHQGSTPVIISAFDEVMGRCIQDDYGNVYTGVLPRIQHWRSYGDRE